MNMKKSITVVLLLFVATAAGTIVFRGLWSGNIAESPESATDFVNPVSDNNAVTDADIDIVYYFMTTQRCPSCMKIEAYTKEAIMSSFADNIEKCTLAWKMVNVDDQENRHFIKDYQLHTKSVVLVRYRDGRQVTFRNLDRVWELLGDKTAFQTYVNHEISEFISEG